MQNEEEKKRQMKYETDKTFPVSMSIAVYIVNGEKHFDFFFGAIFEPISKIRLLNLGSAETVSAQTIDPKHNYIE